MRYATHQPVVLKAEGLTLAVNGVCLIENLDLSLGRGELVAVTGPSGCGKTTLLRVMAGLAGPSRGAIEFEGYPPESLGWPSYRRKVVLVQQRPALLDATVAENLTRPFQYRVADGLFSAELAERLLGGFGLPAAVMQQRARSLSAGEQQRVCLVRALLVKPVALLLDEPTSALDEDAAVIVEKCLRSEARRRGLAALIVTHDRSQARRWCQRSIDLGPWLVRQPGPDGRAGQGATHESIE